MDLIENIQRRDHLFKFLGDCASTQDSIKLFPLVSKQLCKIVNAELSFLLRVERQTLGNDMALYAYLQNEGDQILQKVLVTHLNIETLSSTMWNSMDMTCIEDVDESEIFDENINSIFHCRVNNVVIVPISSDRTD